MVPRPEPASEDSEPDWGADELPQGQDEQSDEYSYTYTSTSEDESL